MCEYCRTSPCPPGCPNAPEPKVVTSCCMCDGDIYEGDDYYCINDEDYCEDCV